MDNYEVTFDNVGNWYRGEVISAEQAGDNLDRWVAIGALTKVVPLGEEEEVEPEVEETLSEVTTPPPIEVAV